MIILTALLLAAQPAVVRKPTVRSRRPAAAAAATPPTAEWLKGLWVADEDKGEAMEGCASWTAVFYQFDGRYLHGDATGKWDLTGSKLERRPFVYAEGGADDEEPTGEVEIARIIRVSQDRLREVAADGGSTTYLRCPTPETPVAR